MAVWLHNEWMTGMLVALAATALLACATTAIRFLKWRGGIAARLVSESSVIDTAQGSVEVANLGQGPVLLMLHGTPGGYDQVFSLVKATGLADEGIRVIVPSRPGYLRTPIESGATPAQQAALFDAMLAKLDIDRAVVLGVSGGGPSALQFAMLFPTRCAGLILEEAVTQQIVERPIRWPALLVDYLIYFFRHRSVAALKSKGVDDPVVLKVAREAGESVSLFGRRKAGQINDLAHFANMPPMPLHTIACRTLILHGTLDKDVPIAHGESAHAQIANSRLVRIEGADHSMPGLHYKQLNALIKQFIMDS
jgi:pimeloyl-ACP methyl ester carboxylesterase